MSLSSVDLADDPILIFQHIAKTAGSTLARIMASRIPAEQQLAVVPRGPHSVLGTWPLADVETAWAALSPAQHASIRWVGGHLRFGVHRVLPRASAYVTLLRDPIDRVVSSFYYSIGRHFEMTGEQVTLEDYVFRKEHYDLGLNNYQTRVICGLADLDCFGPVTTRNARKMVDDDLHLAIDHLSHHYALVGTTDVFDDFLSRLLRLLKLPEANGESFARVNVTPVRPRLEEIPAFIRDEIAENNRFDIQLYQHVSAAFQPLSIASQHPIAPHASGECL